MSTHIEAPGRRRTIYVVDVGSPTAGLAWARLEDDGTAMPTGSRDLDWAASRIAEDLRSGAAVAIGFEAPGCVPVPQEAAKLAKARIGEARAGVSRPWSYGAGAYVTTMAIQIGAWLLREVRMQVGEAAPLTLTLDPAEWGQGANVLLWEAFVSGPGHARAPNKHGVSEHIQDAATAAMAFQTWRATSPRPATAVSCDCRIATFGAIALWAGWTTDIGVLSTEPLVLWPDRPVGDDVVLENVSTNEEPVTATGPSYPETRDAANDGLQALTGVLPLACGDSHSFWRSHQIATQIAEFDRFAALLRGSPSNKLQCSASFDGGTTWKVLFLRCVSANQISWKGFNAGATAASRIAVLIRA